MLNLHSFRPHSTTGTIEYPTIASNGSPDKFLKDVRSTMKMYRRKAKHARNQYVRVGLCTVAFSSLVPAAAVTPIPKWVLAALSAVVITGHGFLALTRPHEHAVLYECAGNKLSLEIRKYEYYSGSNKEQARKNFVANVLALESGFFQQEIEIDGLEGVYGSPETEDPRAVRNKGPN